MKKTWLIAIRLGFYATWPGLLYKLVAKFLPNDTKETAAGHLHCRQQGVQSTRRNNQLEDLEPELEGQGFLNKDQTQRVGVHLLKNETIIEKLNGMISTNQTGKFPKILQRGNKYIMVLYNYDLNAILATAIKGKKDHNYWKGTKNFIAN